MNWFSVKKFLPGVGVGYVITRVENADGTEFIYQAIFHCGKWEFWDEEYWPEYRLKEEKFKVTHWTCMPEMERTNDHHI